MTFDPNVFPDGLDGAGLRKRELYAAVAMHAMLSRDIDFSSREEVERFHQRSVKAAWSIADSMIAASEFAPKKEGE